MKAIKTKKLFNYLLNGILVILVIVLLVPTWRRAFQSRIQQLFLTSVKFDETQNINHTIKANEWILYDENNKTLSFHELNDKPIILNFWATWCPPCLAELPSLFNFYNQIKDFAYVVAVTFENKKTFTDFEEFNNYRGILYRAEQQSPLFKVTAYPTTILLAPNFRQIQMFTGAENFLTDYNIDFIKSLQ